MKKQILLIVALVFAATTWTQAQTVLDFKLVNKTGFTFYAVYLTDTDTEDWGEDILPDAMVEDGDVVDITFDYVDDEDIFSWLSRGRISIIKNTFPLDLIGDLETNKFADTFS